MLFQTTSCNWSDVKSFCYKCCLYGHTNIHIVMFVYLCRMKDVYERTYAGTVGDLCFLFLISKSSGAEPVNATQSNMSSRPIGWATKRERKPTSIILSSNFKALRYWKSYSLRYTFFFTLCEYLVLVRLSLKWLWPFNSSPDENVLSHEWSKDK